MEYPIPKSIVFQFHKISTETNLCYSGLWNNAGIQLDIIFHSYSQSVYLYGSQTISVMNSTGLVYHLTLILYTSNNVENIWLKTTYILIIVINRKGVSQSLVTEFICIIFLVCATSTSPMGIVQSVGCWSWYCVQLRKLFIWLLETSSWLSFYYFLWNFIKLIKGKKHTTENTKHIMENICCYIAIHFEKYSSYF